MLHTDWRNLPTEARGMVLALGNFDGVHRGHAHLLHAAHAARPDAPLGVLTFEPHPRSLFRPEDPAFRLSPSAQRAALLAGLGVRQVIEVHFDTDFAALTAEDFVAHVLHEACGAVHVACGADFAFGHRRGGDVHFLEARAEAFGIGLSIVPQLTDESGPISSSRVRRALQDGYPEHAAILLGRPWAIRGEVAHGDQRGRMAELSTVLPIWADARPSPTPPRRDLRRIYLISRKISTARRSMWRLSASCAPSRNSPVSMHCASRSSPMPKTHAACSPPLLDHTPHRFA